MLSKYGFFSEWFNNKALNEKLIILNNTNFIGDFLELDDSFQNSNPFLIQDNP